MGGGSSKVVSAKGEEELTRRRTRASLDRHKLSLLFLSSGKLSKHAEEISNINKALSKNADKLVDQKAAYTRDLAVSKKSLASKKREIEELKRAERDLQQCESAMDSMKVQLSALMATFEEGLKEMESIHEFQKKRGKNAVPEKPPAEIAPPAPPKVGGFTGDAGQSAPIGVPASIGSKIDDDLQMEDHDEMLDSAKFTELVEVPLVAVAG